MISPMTPVNITRIIQIPALSMPLLFASLATHTRIAMFNAMIATIRNKKPPEQAAQAAAACSSDIGRGCWAQATAGWQYRGVGMNLMIRDFMLSSGI